MPAPLFFRLAGEADLAALHACDPCCAVQVDRRHELGRAVENRACLLAADEGDQIMGFAVLDYGFFRHGFISLVCTAPRHQGRGVGLALLSEVERRCLTPKLFTSTNTSNMRARRLFARAGFVPSGVVENLDDGDPECFYFKQVGFANRQPA